MSLWGVDILHDGPQQPPPALGLLSSTPHLQSKVNLTILQRSLKCIQHCDFLAQKYFGGSYLKGLKYYIRVFKRHIFVFKQFIV